MKTSRSDVADGGAVKLYGHPDSREAYEIRDLLQRSVVQFEWIELSRDAPWPSESGVAPGKIPTLPIVELPDGTRLSAPSLQAVANALGWVTTPRRHEYDLSIYGAGPAGLSAAVYAASEGIKAVVVERRAVGGQAGSSSLIENYMGFPEGISGARLAERARQQAVKFGVDFLMLNEGIRAVFDESGIHVDLANGEKLVARANLCATGVEYRRLGLPDEGAFLGNGLYYGGGAGEAPMCRGEHVVVIGGGNGALQAAMHFSEFANRVSVLVRGSSLTGIASRYLIDRIQQTANVEVEYGTEVTALLGENALQAIEITDHRNDTRKTVRTRHVFACIGGVPNTEWAKDTPIARDSHGYLITGPDLLVHSHAETSWPLRRAPFFLETSVPGSFAAGDVRFGSVKRAVAAAGEGAMAVTFIHRYLHETQQ
ncbi:MAG: NAD(P)/FAD-dependent oxidoreductase [Rhodanobacter sp.]